MNNHTQPDSWECRESFLTLPRIGRLNFPFKTGEPKIDDGVLPGGEGNAAAYGLGGNDFASMDFDRGDGKGAGDRNVEYEFSLSFMSEFLGEGELVKTEAG